MRNKKGQAMIEIAVFMLFIAGLMASLTVFTQWILMRQKILLAAKQGLMLYSSGRFEKAAVDRHMRRYLTSGPPAIDPDERRLRITIGRQPGATGFLYALDRVSVQYEVSKTWTRWLGPVGDIEETCVVAHAPWYGPPFMPGTGPAVGW